MKNIEITRDLYNEIVSWGMALEQDPFKVPVINGVVLNNMPDRLKRWWQAPYTYKSNRTELGNDRLIALIAYLNGKYTFIIKKQKKFVVRNKGVSDGAVLGDNDPYYYVEAFGDQTYMVKGIEDATYFDSEFEACQYKNSHQVVIEVEV